MHTREMNVSDGLDRIGYWDRVKENRIYIRVESRQSLGMNFVSLKGSSKCTIHINVYKLYEIEYINTVLLYQKKLDKMK